MNRRTALKWLSGTLGTFCAAIIVLPGLGFITDVLRRRGRSQATAQRVARYDDLPVGKPSLAPMFGSHTDAWIVTPNEVIGRVWLVRQSSAAGNDMGASVTAFSSVCPHLGCTVQVAAAGDIFQCPCHQAKFQFDGQRAGVDNPSRRGLDTLDCQLEQDPATGQWWVAVKYGKFEPGLAEKVRRA